MPYICETLTGFHHHHQAIPLLTAEVRGRRGEIDTWRKETRTRRDGESSAPVSPGWFYVFHFFSFFSFPSGGLGGKVMRDLAGPSATYGGFDLPTEPPCCYTRLKRRRGNILFSILFVASALAAAAHASFMPQRSNRAIKEGAKKRRGILICRKQRQINI